MLLKVETLALSATIPSTLAQAALPHLVVGNG
jgi:hypothetical protein